MGLPSIQLHSITCTLNVYNVYNIISSAQLLTVHVRLTSACGLVLLFASHWIIGSLIVGACCSGVESERKRKESATNTDLTLIMTCSQLIYIV